MPLKEGSRLGPYEILAPLGAGGMGEVYRARDSRLARDVAIKVLPEGFSKDTDRVTRFKREAQLLASLNHPNIAAIYGLEESNGAGFLVLEFVPGQTLADCLSIGPLPVDEALQICLQITEALEGAHEKGIIHRDLKPANIKVTPEGKVKVLDFGLAKASTSDMSPSDLAHSPTIARYDTREGVILGTAPYMSPEQARGKPVDKRSDVWSFGCVLYELLAGRKAFGGDTVSDTIANILEHDPDWKALPERTPLKVRDLLRRCFQKEPHRRLRDIGDARIEIEDFLAAPATFEAITSAIIPPAKGWRRAIPFSQVGGIALLAAVSSGIIVFKLQPLFFGTRTGNTTIRFSVLPPEKTTFREDTGPAISPDGRRLAFVAIDSSGKTFLWVRPLDSITAQLLPGTDDAAGPFWSPDSRHIGFCTPGKLKKIDASGGIARTLCDAGWSTGTWNRDGVILFKSGDNTICRIQAAGGMPTPVTTLDLARKETMHRSPQFLPDGRHFLYFVRSDQRENEGMYLGSIDSKQTRRLLTTDWEMIYAAPGYLLFTHEGTLMAQLFDPARFELRGEAFPIAEQVDRNLVAVSENGVLAYCAGSKLQIRRLVWFDREGKELGPLGLTNSYSPQLSPDGKYVAVARLDSKINNRDIWLVEVSRDIASRFTFDRSIVGSSIFSPDGNNMAYGSQKGEHFALFLRPTSRLEKEEVLLEPSNYKYPLDWSPDGRFILYSTVNNEGWIELWTLPLFGDRKPQPFLQAQFHVSQGAFSPNGKWLAYSSKESGRYEVYVQTFPASGGKWQVSTNGGYQSRWRRDGKELFYISADRKLMAVSVKTDTRFESGVSRLLFEPNLGVAELGLGFNHYTVTADGRRFLIDTQVEEPRSTPITVVLNWTADLKR